MHRIGLIARRRFEWQGRTFAEGEALTSAPLEAVILINRRDARLDPRQPTPVAPTPSKAPKPKRTYKRRDLVAEGS